MTILMVMEFVSQKNQYCWKDSIITIIAVIVILFPWSGNIWGFHWCAFLTPRSYKTQIIFCRTRNTGCKHLPQTDSDTYFAEQIFLLAEIMKKKSGHWLEKGMCRQESMIEWNGDPRSGTPTAAWKLSGQGLSDPVTILEDLPSTSHPSVFWSGVKLTWGLRFCSTSNASVQTLPTLNPRSQLFQSHFIDGGVEVRGSWAICLEVTSEVEARIWAPWIPVEYPTTLPKAWSMDHIYSQPTVLSLIAPWAMTPSCDEK